MTYDERVVRRSRVDDPEIVTRDAEVVVDRAVEVRPSGGEMLRRAVVLFFGVIQILIVLRIFLLLLDAREGNAIVAFVLDASQVFVAPFHGIFGEDALRSGGSIFDVAATAALVGWTVLEMIVLWVVALFRREPTARV
jgi:hypothetical protein